MCIEVELRFILFGLLLNFLLICLKSDSIINKLSTKLVTLLSIFLSAILFKYIKDLGKNCNRCKEINTCDEYLKYYKRNSSAINRKEIHEIKITNIPNYSNIHNKLRRELGNIHSLK